MTPTSPTNAPSDSKPRLRPRACWGRPSVRWAFGLTLVAATISGACDGGNDPSESTAPAVDSAKAEGAAAAEGADAAEAVERAPEPEAVLEAHVEAIGGREALAKVRSLYVESSVELPARGVTGESRSWWRDGSFLVEEQLEGLGVSAAGYDGTTLWVKDSFRGWREVEGKEAELYARGSSPFLIADWQKHFTKAEYVGTRKDGERELIDLRLVTPLDQAVVMSFDAETHRLRETAFDEPTPQGSRRVVVRAENYEPAEGIAFARLQVTRSPLGEVRQSITKIDLHPEIDANRFAPPHRGQIVPADPHAGNAGPAEGAVAPDDDETPAADDAAQAGDAP